jgi:2,6-dihydroxypyridine 3-monooxygenase
MSPPPNPLRIGIAGGSIGGLTAGVLLHELGHDVHIFERSTAALEDRGAGIVVLPITERYFTEKGAALGETGVDLPEVALNLTNWSYIDPSGTIIDAVPTNNRFTSWNTLYRALLDAMPGHRYHLSHQVSAVDQTGDEVTVSFAAGGSHRCDLLVAADGMASTVRAIVSPDTATRYAGYVGWRGTVLEQDLPPEISSAFADAIIYQVLDHSHVLVYAIPASGGSIVVGERALNFVWYRNVTTAAFADLMTDREGNLRPATVPPGLVQDSFVEELQVEAAEFLAPQLREVIRACDEPFIQALFDMVADRLVHGRVVLLGDAASVVRPHVGAGAAKACADAWALRDHLAAGDDVATALGSWEAQQLGLARTVVAKSRRMGESSQVHATMRPGDREWRFGLFGPGD